MGIDTVKMGGDGFKQLVRSGQKVKMGDPMLEVDFDKVRAAGYPTTTMTIVSNGYDFDVKKLDVEGKVAATTGVLDVTRKDA